MVDSKNILVTICARSGSKGLPGKNIRSFSGQPLIVHSIQQALAWKRTAQVIVSTDSQLIADIARTHGAAVPFLRPRVLSTDRAGKLPVITHAHREAEAFFGHHFEFVMDLDVTAPVRTQTDLEKGWKVFQKSKKQICFSVVPARKNPYFNMVEKTPAGIVQLSKRLEINLLSRQSAPIVWEANASIYFYTRDFLVSNPQTLWDGEPEIFEMPPESRFDIDEELDFIIAEKMMKYCEKNQNKTRKKYGSE